MQTEIIEFGRNFYFYAVIIEISYVIHVSNRNWWDDKNKRAYKNQIRLINGTKWTKVDTLHKLRTGMDQTGPHIPFLWLNVQKSIIRLFYWGSETEKARNWTATGQHKHATWLTYWMAASQLDWKMRFVIAHFSCIHSTYLSLKNEHQNEWWNKRNINKNEKVTLVPKNQNNLL